MQAAVISTINQLAAACKKYKGIVSIDNDNNIIKDTNDLKTVIYMYEHNNLEITRLENYNINNEPKNVTTTGQITRV